MAASQDRPTIAHVVFDIGRVLIHYDPEIPYRRLIPDEEARRRFLKEICTGEWNIEQDRGRSWKDAEEDLIAAHPHEEKMIRAFRLNWSEMVSHAYEKSVALYRDVIATGIDVTLLTNFSADTFAEALDLFPFLTEARGVTVSGEVRLIKPDADIFRLHQSRFSLDPAHTLFIDDSRPNVEAARQEGWQAVHFTDPEILRQELKNYAVL